MRYELEKYSGSGSRHTCPACGRSKKLTRYIDKETGRYLPDHVGRCDRETSCGYHFKPSEYFAENREYKDLAKPNIRAIEKPGISWQGRKRENVSQANYSSGNAIKRPDFIDKCHLIESLSNYEQNAFVEFLLGLFPFEAEDVIAAVNEYKIGTGSKGETIFWQMDTRQRIRTGKLIAYDSQTGNRRKDRSPNWIHSHLKKNGHLTDNFELQQCFFGEHLLNKYPGRAIAMVEAEKTAVIASICKRVFPDLVWIACGGLSELNIGNIERIGHKKKVFLFPDANGFDKWQGIASEARKRDVAVNVSDLLEKRATRDQKLAGMDLADYLIDNQTKRNDPANRAAFRDLIEERIAVMTIDGGMSEADAESYLQRSGFMKYAEHCVLSSA